MKNLTRLFIMAALLMITNVCWGGGTWHTQSLHVKAVAIGKGQVYLHCYNAYGGTKEYGTIDKDGNYVPTEVLTWDEENDVHWEHQYVFSPYGAYVYAAVPEKDLKIHPVSLYAVPGEGQKLLGVYPPNAAGTGPDYTKRLMCYQNGLESDGTLQPDNLGSIAVQLPQVVPVTGILPEDSITNPNPPKYFDATPNFSEDGVVETENDHDYIHVNARTDWSAVNTIFYVVFSDDPTGPSYTITECRKFTNIPTKLDSRQSTLLDGKLYIKIKGVEPQIMVYDATGILDTIISAPDANTTNICHDDAGNIIYRQSGAFPGVPGATEADVLTVITPDGERRTVTLPLAGAGLPATRLDFYSDVVGNILEGEAYFFYPESGTNNLYIVTFDDGVVDPAKCGMVTLDGAYFDTASKLYPFGDGKFISHYRGANPILFTYAYNDSNWDVETVGNIDCPGRYNSNGITTFKLDTVDYIAYPSGTGYFDGFSIAKLTTDGTTTEAAAVFEQTTTAMTSGFQSNWLFSEKVDEENALIYQYFPGGWVKVFRFTASQTTPSEFPAQIYMAGSYNSWNYASCTTLAQDTQLKGLYSTAADIAFNNNATFAISEANGEEAAFNAAKWGAADNAAIADQQPLPIAKDGENLSIVSGNHTIVVDLLTHRVYGAGNLPYKKEDKPTEDPIVAEDYYVHVVYAEEGETKVLNANTKYLERIQNLTEEEVNSLQFIFRTGTESAFAGETITIAEKDLQSVEVKKGSEMQK